MDSIPFHFDTYGGFGEVRGLARLDELGLELQFSSRDAMFGVLKSRVRSVRVPVEALLSVRYRAGFCWLMPKIELRVRDLTAFGGLPESEQGRVCLGLAWGDRADGRAFAADLERMRAHRRIQQLDRQLERMAAPLPSDWRQPPPLPDSGGAGGRRSSGERDRSAASSLE